METIIICRRILERNPPWLYGCKRMVSGRTKRSSTPQHKRFSFCFDFRTITKACVVYNNINQNHFVLDCDLGRNLFLQCLLTINCGRNLFFEQNLPRAQNENVFEITLQCSDMKNVIFVCFMLVQTFSRYFTIFEGSYGGESKIQHTKQIKRAK